MSRSIASAPVFVPEGLWVVDPEASSVRFGVRHLLAATVEGTLGGIAGTVSADGRGVRGDGTVQVETIDTGMRDRDTRLRGPGFFDAERWPQLAFRAHDARPNGHGSWAVGGEVAIMGCSAPMTFTATVLDGRRGPRIKARGSLSRSELGLDWPGLLHSGRAMVGDRVLVELDLALR